MPKIRTKKSMAKRIKFTGTGKVKRMRTFSGCSHILEKKSPKRIRKFRKAAMASPADVKMIKRLVPYGK